MWTSLAPVDWPQNPIFGMVPARARGYLSVAFGLWLARALVERRQEVSLCLKFRQSRRHTGSSAIGFLCQLRRAVFDGGHCSHRCRSQRRSSGAQKCRPTSFAPGIGAMSRRGFSGIFRISNGTAILIRTISGFVWMPCVRSWTVAMGCFLCPLIRNEKTIDPRDKSTPKVFQLETAMGAAIECFDGARAIEVPRNRFSPVKTTADLLAVRSDAYELDPEFRLVLRPERNADAAGNEIK